MNYKIIPPDNLTRPPFNKTITVPYLENVERAMSQRLTNATKDIRIARRKLRDGAMHVTVQGWLICRA